MKKVLRLQYKDGEGIFRRHPLVTAKRPPEPVWDMIVRAHRFPNGANDFDFYRDELLSDEDVQSYRFGCHNLETFEEWFGEHLGAMLGTGEVEIRELTVKDYVVGQSGKQCMYKVQDVLDEKILLEGLTN